jgi:hypothetical protein
MYFQMTGNIVTGSANALSGKQHLSCGHILIPFTSKDSDGQILILVLSI